MLLARLVGVRVPRGGLKLIPGALLLGISAALLGWSVPRLKGAFLEQEIAIPTTHISAGSDCAFGQENRIEFDIDARKPATFVLAFRDIAPPSAAYPCQYIYVRFPGRIEQAYAYGLSGPMMATESKENIYEHRPGKEPVSGNAFLNASSEGDTRLTVAVSKLSEPVRSGDIYIRGELNAFLSRSSFSDKVLHYWVRLPASRIRGGCQTETECEDDYIKDNPHVGSISLVFSKELGVKSVLLAQSNRALTREGLARITTEDLTGAVVVEDREKARDRDVILLYAGALFATGIAVGTDGLLEFIRFALDSNGLARRRRDAGNRPSPLRVSRAFQDRPGA